MSILIPLDSLEILAIVDNELDPMSPAPLSVTVSGRLGDIALTKGRDVVDTRGSGIVKEIAMEQLCCGAHGLSLMITGTANATPQTLLFDTGPTESIWCANAARLSPLLHSISLIHLSHWHRDHSGGMLAALRAISSAKASIPASLPSPPSPLTTPSTVVDLHPSRPTYRGFITPLGTVSLEADPSFAEIEAAGGKVSLQSTPHLVLNDYFLISGEIPRVTEYERGVRAGMRYEDGVWVPDELILDERFVVCHVKDKGLVLFTGCSHAGLINCCLHALALTSHLSPPVPLYAVVGGYHLADAEPLQLASTVSALKTMNVKVLMAGHCTGWRAKFEIEKEMPGCLVPSFVGIKTMI